MKRLIVSVLLLSTFTTASVFAYEITHPNLKDAYHNIDEAIEHIHAAYVANGDKGAVFGGHAEAADKLLAQAKQEIIEADRYRNEHTRK